MEEGVTLKKNNGLGIIEFSHPQSNSMPGKLLRELADAIDDAGIDPEIIVILLKSTGEKTFCAGASFDELLTIKNEKTGWDFFMGICQCDQFFEEDYKICNWQGAGKMCWGRSWIGGRGRLLFCH
jgi:methylglutaconyl-CoA hydratase